MKNFSTLNLLRVAFTPPRSVELLTTEPTALKSRLAEIRATICTLQILNYKISKTELPALDAVS